MMRVPRKMRLPRKSQSPREMSSDSFFCSVAWAVSSMIHWLCLLRLMGGFSWHVYIPSAVCNSFVGPSA